MLELKGKKLSNLRYGSTDPHQRCFAKSPNQPSEESAGPAHPIHSPRSSAPDQQPSPQPEFTFTDLPVITIVVIINRHHRRL